VPLEVNTTAPNKNKTVAANFNLTTDFITPPKEWIPRRLRRGGTTHRRICGASANHPGIAGYPREGKCGRRVGIVPHGQCVLLTVRHGHSVQVGSFRPRFPMVSPGSRTLRTPPLEGVASAQHETPAEHAQESNLQLVGDTACTPRPTPPASGGAAPSSSRYTNSRTMPSVFDITHLPLGDSPLDPIPYAG